MPVQPDRHPGTREEDAIEFTEETSHPTIERTMQFVQSNGLEIFVDGVSRGVGEDRVNIYQFPVDNYDVDTPPGSPTTGYRVIVGDSPTGDFVGHAGEIAQYNGSSWVFTTPQQGTQAYCKTQDNMYCQTATSTPWVWQAGPQPNFGAWYDDEQDPDEQGTTGSSWVEALRLDFPSDLEEGDYLVMCALLAYGSSSSTQIGLRQRFDSTVLCDIVMQPTGTAVQMPLANYHVEKTISGSHSYYIEFNKSGGAGTAYVSNVVIISIRVA